MCSSMESSPKTPLTSTSKPSSSSLSKLSDPDNVTGSSSNQDPWNTKTPEKPIDPPRFWTRTRSTASVSLEQIRQAAQELCKSDTTHLHTRPDSVQWSDESQMGLCFSGSPETKPADPVNLPEKYEMLHKFFGALESSIRLLQLKGSSTTFTNISSKVECLTDRRFSYDHLAKLKFILPEAIEVKKILVYDEHTNCMKPELLVALNANAVEVDEKLKHTSPYVQLRNVFRTRLLNFIKSHPQGDDIPEEALPGSFGQSKQEILTNLSGSACSQLDETPTGSVPEQPTSASHLSQSFRRSCLHRVSKGETEDSVLCPPVTECQFAKSSNKNCQEMDIESNSSPKASSRREDCPSSNKQKTSPFPNQYGNLTHFDQSKTSTASEKCPSRLTTTQTNPTKYSSRRASDTLLLSRLPATPIKNIEGDDGDTLLTNEGTPASLTSTPVNLMTSTPMSQPPKRCLVSPISDSTESPSKLVTRPPRNRSLIFNTPVKSSKVTAKACLSAKLSRDDDIIDILPEDLLQSIQEKKRKALEEQVPAISQVKWREQMISSLPMFFDMIYFLFQSIKRVVITKEELMHKVISSHLEIADRREVEEQLKLLQELAPEWIHEKLTSSGDLLLCVNKISSPEAIRSRLGEAK